MLQTFIFSREWRSLSNDHRTRADQFTSSRRHQSKPHDQQQIPLWFHVTADFLFPWLARGRRLRRHLAAGVWRSFHVETQNQDTRSANRNPENCAPEPLPVERGDFLGIHYPKNTSEGIIVHSIPLDNAIPQSEMFQTLVVDVYDGDLPTDHMVDMRRYSQYVESKTFALLGYLGVDLGPG